MSIQNLPNVTNVAGNKYKQESYDFSARDSKNNLITFNSFLTETELHEFAKKNGYWDIQLTRKTKNFTIGGNGEITLHISDNWDTPAFIKDGCIDFDAEVALKNRKF